MTAGADSVLLAASLRSWPEGIDCDWIVVDHGRHQAALSALLRFLTAPPPIPGPVRHGGRVDTRRLDPDSRWTGVDLWVVADGPDRIRIDCEPEHRIAGGDGRPGLARPWRSFRRSATTTLDRRRGSH